VSWSVRQLLEFQQQLHPQLRVQDVYKLFFEAAFGVGHIIRDSVEATSNLTKEMETLNFAPEQEPLLERISLSDNHLRVNLRPFMALNLSPDLLVQVMLESSRETVPDTLLFYRMWNEFSALVRFGLMDFPEDDLRVWDTKVQDGVVEPVHHSTEYGTENGPAYRVVRRDMFEEAFGKRSQ
jgi:hypothetical protein